MTALPSIRNSRLVGRACWLALVLFSIRAIVPMGYMPAALSEGGPFALCPGASLATPEASGTGEQLHDAGAPHDAGATLHAGTMHENGAMVADAGELPAFGHPGSGHPPAGHDERWERCELGIGAADAAIAGDFTLPVSVPADRSDNPVVANSPGQRLVVRYRARAPPA